MLSTRGGLAPLLVLLLACTRGASAREPRRLPPRRSRPSLSDPPAPETTLTTPVPPFPSSLAGVAHTTALETVLLDEVKAGSIEHDEQLNYDVEASACSGYLHVELWDTGRGGADEADAMADPMLMVRREYTPRASYERDNNDWRFSEDTYVDLEGYRLMREYHRVVVDMRSCDDACARACEGSSAPNCQVRCATDCDEPDRDDAKPFIVGIKNVRVWVQQTLRFRVLATCVPYDINDIPPCPRPLGVDAGECGGRGSCGAPAGLAGGEVDRLALASGACSCSEGWGDVGCDEPLVELVANAESPVAATVQPGEWAYFYVDVAAPSSAASGANLAAALLVEMRRDGGDPVLFVKRADGSDDETGETGGSGDGGWYAEGADDAWQTPSAGTTPWVGDYANFADADGFRARLNYHYLTLADARIGRYYVAVFNNDVYLKERKVAHVTVNAKVAFGAGLEDGAGDPPLCPMACGADDDAPRGSCLPPAAAVGAAPVGTCACAAGFAGDACEGTLATTTVAKSDAAGVSGTLAPGAWAYVRFEVDADAAAAGVVVSFRHSGGHPVLLLSRGEIPDLLNAHYVLSTSERLERRAQFKISSRDLSPGTYFVAVHNMNYYADSACEYVVAIESSLANEYAMTSPGFMTVVLVVIMGAFVCMALSVCRRLFARAMRRRGAPGGVLFGGRDEDWGDVAMAGGARRRSAPRGCPRAVVDAIPRVVFGSEEWDSGKWSAEDESCSVCIDAFERGETLLCLPECQHAFHKDCIEGWLAQNTTCPNCRASLVSAEGGEDVEAARGGRGGAAPASPPGVVEGAPTSSDFDRIADEAREEARRGRRGGAPVLEASERPATLTPVQARRS